MELEVLVKRVNVTISTYSKGVIDAQLEFRPTFVRSDLDKLFALFEKQGINLSFLAMNRMVVRSFNKDEGEARRNLLNFLDELSNALGYKQVILPNT